LKFDSVGRLGGITVSTVETTAITKDESFGTPAVSVATFLTASASCREVKQGTGFNPDFVQLTREIAQEFFAKAGSNSASGILVSSLH
jgi:hypothetical protein